MIFCQEDHILIRNMCEADAQRFADAEVAQGWLDSTADKFLMRLRHQAEGKAVSLVAEWDGEVAGYVNVYPDAQWGALGKQGLPEIVDFAVLEKFRCHGIGSRLMDAAEAVAAGYADRVYLGVGLHQGYGPAQRLYVKRGYIPDGSGVWYRDQVCQPYAACCNDDDLVLYLVKKLK